MRCRTVSCSVYLRVEKPEEELSGKITRLVVEWEAKRQADEELLQAELEQQDTENNQEDDNPEVSSKASIVFFKPDGSFLSGYPS